jgi:hypothetical protein
MRGGSTGTGLIAGPQMTLEEDNRGPRRPPQAVTEYTEEERQKEAVEKIKKKIEGNIEIKFRKDIEQLNRQIKKFGEKHSLVKGARERLEKNMEKERQRLMQALSDG